MFENYSWQLYGGYTFLHFFELPNTTQSMNGFNYSLVYYWKDWFGFDGEFAAAHATQADVSSWFLFGGGGPRFRWSARKGVELWAHALVGGTHFTPQTPAGSQGKLSLMNSAVALTCPSNHAGPFVWVATPCARTISARTNIARQPTRASSSASNFIASQITAASSHQDGTTLERQSPDWRFALEFAVAVAFLCVLRFSSGTSVLNLLSFSKSSAPLREFLVVAWCSIPLVLTLPH